MLQIEEIKKEQLHLIKQLWIQLNDIHKQDSTHFKDNYNNLTFEERSLKFSEIDSKKIKIDVLIIETQYVGYCISTINDNGGELDSLFIDPGYRKNGEGHKLVERSISWLKNNNCPKIQVSVAEGHESVFSFYKKFGFYPKITQLVLKETK